MRLSKLFGLFFIKFCLLASPAISVVAAEATGNQSVLQPASPQAVGINTLWWFMLAVASVIFLLVMAVLFTGLWRARHGNANTLSYLQSRNLVIAAGIVMPLLVIIFLIGGSLKLGSTLSSTPPVDAINVEIKGWRWWWEISYLNAQGEVIAVTANEMHVPKDRAVALRLVSEDVIHSFWVPELHGKTDMIPGVVNTSWFLPTEEGVFRGQCAEFCGVQHTLMAFLTVVESEADFTQWLNNLQQVSVSPATELNQEGQDVFIDSGCAACHTIRGTQAAGSLGPELTHIGSRSTLAAATSDNTIGHLGGWIIDPQSMKPGNLMPATSLSSNELQALTAYLQSLQ